MSMLAWVGSAAVAANWSFLLLAPALCPAWPPHGAFALTGLILVAWPVSTRLLLRLGLDSDPGGRRRRLLSLTAPAAA